MKIAVFTKKTTFHSDYGGMETQNKVLVEGLAKRGHEITVFSPKWDLNQQEADENGVNYVFVDCVYRMGPIFGFFGTKQDSNWINRSYKVFKESHDKSAFELVLAQSSTGLGIIKNKKKHGIKVISISHGSIIGEYKTFLSSMSFPRDALLLLKNTGFTLKNFFRRQRDFVHGSDKVIAVSNYVKQAIIDETFTFDEKITVINNGIDPTPFDNDLPGSRGSKLFYVGQVIKSKGLEEIPQLLSFTDLSEATIDIIGSGDYIEELKDRLRKEPTLDKRVNLLGKLPYDQTLSHFKNPQYGAFVFPTKRAEGFPMVLAEAMFAGLPIVAYDQGGVSDAVKNGENGFLIPQDDSKIFAQKVAELVSNQNLRDEFSASAVKMAREKLTLDYMLDQYEKVFAEVLS